MRTKLASASASNVPASSTIVVQVTASLPRSPCVATPRHRIQPPAKDATAGWHRTSSQTVAGNFSPPVIKVAAVVEQASLPTRAAKSEYAGNVSH